MTTAGAEVPVEISGAAAEGSGRKPPEHGSGASNVTATRGPSWTEAEGALMERIISRPNMMAALERVEANKGAPGIDGMTTRQLRGYLKERWPTIREDPLPRAVNGAFGSVDRPWKRVFLGYSMTFHHKPRLKVADARVKRFKAGLREVCRRGRGRSIARVIEEITPKLRGWASYFRLAEVKGVFEDLDGWLRRKLRCILWRQWKRPYTRARKLMRRGLTEARAWRSATNGRGPWWNAGASHMNEAYPTSYLRKLGLICLIDQHRRFQNAL